MTRKEKIVYNYFALISVNFVGSTFFSMKIMLALSLNLWSVTIKKKWVPRQKTLKNKEHEKK